MATQVLFGEIEHMIINNLLKSISILSSDHETQEVYIEELGVAPSLDELALDFDNWFSAARSKPELEHCLPLLQELEESISALSGKGYEVWEVDALTGREWESIREKARQAHTCLEQYLSHV